MKTASRPCRGLLTCLILVALPLPSSGAEPARDSAAVVDRKTLSADTIACERIAVGEPDDYKPCIALLPGGELILTAFHQEKKEGNQVLEQNLLFRSRDGGRT